MDTKEAEVLVARCLPHFESAGLPRSEAGDVQRVTTREMASLWGGMGKVYEISISSSVSSGGASTIVAKRIQLPTSCSSLGDQRKKDSYDVEAAFYSRGHAQRLVAADFVAPRPLLVERSRSDGLTICMTRLHGRAHRMDYQHAEAVLSALARLHATYWGKRADEAIDAQPDGGLQPQGTYWYLDTRPDEHAAMPMTGWQGRLRLAARAIDLRLKADPLQTVCHGDAKSANIIFEHGSDGSIIPLFYDFQYCGKAAATKDLAYFLNVAVDDAGSEEKLVNHYHTELSGLLKASGHTVPTMEMLKTSLALSYADLGRFLVEFGFWGHANIKTKIAEVLAQLDQGQALASEEEYIDAMQRVFPVSH